MQKALAHALRPRLIGVPTGVQQQGFFIWCADRPRSLAGSGRVLSSRRKSQRWMPQSRCRPMCASPSTVLAWDVSAQKMQAQTGVYLAYPKLKASGCALGSGAVQDGATYRKALKVIQIAERWLQHGTLKWLHTGLESAEGWFFNSPKACFCPSRA